MTNRELRAAVVQKAVSREKKNQYTQGDKRTQVGSGFSDCSSFVRWCYLQILGVDIGGNTAAQIVNRKLALADQSGESEPKEAYLLPGDLLYFKGSDPSRPLGVGHVEMYIGSGKLIGHGSGVGPTIKAMKSYCKGRAAAGRGYIKALRLIPAEDKREAGGEIRIRIIGGAVNIRSGPGTGFSVAKAAKAGETYEKVEAGGWRPLLLSGKVCWVSESYSEEVGP